MKTENLTFKVITFECRNCSSIFKTNLPIDNASIKLISKSGKEAWINTFGTGGYLEIIARLAPEEKAISMSVFKTLKIDIEKLIENDAEGEAYQISTSINRKCRTCDSSETHEINEAIISKRVLFLENLVR